jgi:hypothetical protein
MRTTLAVSALLAVSIASLAPASAQTVNVTPNQQTTQASAVSSPSGQNISQQNNFFDPAANAFGPGVQCTGPFIASNVYRNDSSTPGFAGGFTSTGGTIALVVPLNGTSRKCEQFVNEILFQKQLDTCLSMAKQGFSFDPNGQYGELAKRCQGIKFAGTAIPSANPISPSPPPTVITVPAIPSATGTAPVSLPGIPHAAAPVSGPPLPQIALVPRREIPESYCQRITLERKKALLATVKRNDGFRESALDMLHAACVSDAEIVAAL